MLELIREFSKPTKRSGKHPQKQNDLSVKSPKDDKSKTLKISKISKTDVSGNWLAFKASNALTSDSKVRKEIHPSRVKNAASTKQFSGETPREIESKTKQERKLLINCVALDCEMVGVFDGKESVLARVSVVDFDGKCVYDKFVKPKENVVDYRTHVSGVRPSDLKNAETFEVVQKEVAAILKGKILVGHALKNDLKALLLSHPPAMIRDTSSFKLFRDLTNGRNPSLKKLASQILGITIQSGEHSSVEDARAAMQLYNLYQKEWENLRKEKKSSKKSAHAVKLIDPLQVVRSGRKTPASNPLLDEYRAF